MKTKLEPIPDLSEADFLHRVGITLTGTREIARYMGVSAMTILRWHERYRGRTDPWLCFPLLFTPTGKGRGWTYKAHTGLIAEWMQRWSEIDSKERQTRVKRPRRKKALQIGVTRKPEGAAPIAGESRPSLHEELPKLTPAEQAIIKNELTAAQREEVGRRSKPVHRAPGVRGAVPLRRAEPVLGPQRVAA